ncbi:unnamed protein product [Oikopleura dioica]|uniref:Uncharacterized protein n=1 Tax=Oikopleura dioica TaxID=34765 RepID=E4XB76_OIKDI|nr:unnamed protein product [Oikopleura dioica]
MPRQLNFKLELSALQSYLVFTHRARVFTFFKLHFLKTYPCHNFQSFLRNRVYFHPKRKSESTKNHKNEKAEIMEENDFQIDSLTALENLVQEVGKDQNHPWHKIEEVFEDLIDSY